MNDGKPLRKASLRLVFFYFIKTFFPIIFQGMKDGIQDVRLEKLAAKDRAQRELYRRSMERTDYVRG